METLVNSELNSFRISGNLNGPWLTLSHPIGSSLAVWDPILAHLEKEFRVLVYDVRGHGGNNYESGEVTFDELASDCIALWDKLGIANSHFVGLSLGGCIGLALASIQPERVLTLTVACSRLEMDEQAKKMWLDRSNAVMSLGMAHIVDGTIERWLTPEFQSANSNAVMQIKKTLESTSSVAFSQAALALASGQPISRLSSLKMPVLYLAGDRDKAVSVQFLHHYHELTPKSRLAVLHGPHFLHVECPKEFASIVTNFCLNISD